MPRLDGTGPQGLGPMTGRGLGPCGWGMRCGYGPNRGWLRYTGRNYLTKGEEVKELEEEAKDLKTDLKAVRERLDELKSK